MRERKERGAFPKKATPEMIAKKLKAMADKALDVRYAFDRALAEAAKRPDWREISDAAGAYYNEDPNPGDWLC